MTTITHFDIIGDIHGQHAKLIQLLRKLGYTHNGRFWQPPIGHMALFVGDFVDRGVAQLATLQTVFAMIDNGTAHAVMGNHEYNAIGWLHPIATNTDGTPIYQREHNATNRANHAAFLDEVIDGSALHTYWINRLLELPLWFELPQLRLVHAFWAQSAIDLLVPIIPDGRLSVASFAQINNDKALKSAVYLLIKGAEACLPKSCYYLDGGGVKRKLVRLKWWEMGDKPLPLRTVAMNGAQIVCAHCAAADELDAPATLSVPAPNDDKPIFIGHYWLEGAPAILSHRVVCVDYSAARRGHLTAYRHKMGAPLANRHFVQYSG